MKGGESVGLYEKNKALIQQKKHNNSAKSKWLWGFLCRERKRTPNQEMTWVFRLDMQMCIYGPSLIYSSEK